MNGRNPARATVQQRWATDPPGNTRPTPDAVSFGTPARCPAGVPRTNRTVTLARPPRWTGLAAAPDTSIMTTTAFVATRTVVPANDPLEPAAGLGDPWPMRRPAGCVGPKTVSDTQE